MTKLELIAAAIEHDPLKCLEWPFFKIKDSGYGQIRFRGRLDYSHRASFIIHKGEIPDGEEICHSCDNPPCFNPHHLFSGTRSDNMQDASEKGRTFRPVGELCGRSVLTEVAVMEIRSIYRPGIRGFGYKSLARKYGVGFTTMRAVLAGRSWSHLL